LILLSNIRFPLHVDSIDIHLYSNIHKIFVVCRG